MGFFSSFFKVADNSLSLAVKEGASFIDVRTASEFAAGSIKDAVNIPLDSVPFQLAKFKNRKKIVVFCRSGNRSAAAKKILEQNGFANVIDGGTLQKVQHSINNK